MKILVPNYSCLQNPWLGGYRSQIPVFSVLCPQLNLLNPPSPRKKFLGTPLVLLLLVCVQFGFLTPGGLCQFCTEVRCLVLRIERLHWPTQFSALTLFLVGSHVKVGHNAQFLYKLMTRKQRTDETKTIDIVYRFRKGSTGSCRKKSYIHLVNPFARP